MTLRHPNMVQHCGCLLFPWT